MKKIKYIAVMLILVLCVMAHYRGISHAGPTGVAGSKHDMSIEDAGFGSTKSPILFDTLEVCVFCHTPHGANPGMRPDTLWDGSSFTNAAPATGKPFMLWNRAVVNAPTTGYNLYTSSSMSQSMTQVWTYSLMCMSCHDGVSAINVLHNQPNDMFDDNADGLVDPITTADQIGDVENNPANIGDRWPGDGLTVTDLSNDHPVSFDYTISQGNKPLGLKAATNGFVTDPKLRLFPNPTDLAAGNVAMECTTCHDVHNEGSPDGVGPYAYKYPFLAVTSAGSYICTRCHIK